jgi:lipoprotein-anchoring transpeptidase ErfK/SrfK
MAIRPIFFAALALGCALPTVASAQYYPPYRVAPPADVYRGPPPGIEDDDDDVPGSPRGPYVIPAPGPYRAAPAPYYDEARRYPGERYGGYAPPRRFYRDGDPYGPPRPPAEIYPGEASPRAYGPPPAYGRAPAQPGYPPQYPEASRQPNYGAQPGYGGQPGYGAQPGYETERPTGSIGRQSPSGQNTAVAALPPDYEPESGSPKELPQHLRRQLVDYRTKEPAGTLVVDTPNTYLYLVLGNGKAMRYGIGVGREGFTWAGEERVSKMAEWPDWHPPAEMIERQPYLPRFMAGGPSNPLGARALYLGKSVYRIHGTNQPSTIGQFVSSGCIRLVNDDIEDLYSRVQVGSRVVVLPGGKPQSAGAAREIYPPQFAR